MRQGMVTEVTTSIIGIGLLLLGAYNAYGHVQSGQPWSWTAVAAMGLPIALGVAFGWPSSARRTLSAVAEFVPVLEDPLEDES